MQLWLLALGFWLLAFRGARQEACMVLFELMGWSTLRAKGQEPKAKSLKPVAVELTISRQQKFSLSGQTQLESRISSLVVARPRARHGSTGLWSRRSEGPRLSHVAGPLLRIRRQPDDCRGSRSSGTRPAADLLRRQCGR